LLGFGQWHRGFKKVVGVGSFNSPPLNSNRQLKISDRDWGFSAPNFAFLNENFQTRTKVSNSFPTAQNLGGRVAPQPLATTPLLGLLTYYESPF